VPSPRGPPLVQVTATMAETMLYSPSLSNGQPMLQDHRSDRHTNSAVRAGMLDFVDSRPFATGLIGAIAAMLCLGHSEQ
jgi:hypothetical protein